MIFIKNNEICMNIYNNINAIRNKSPNKSQTKRYINNKSAISKTNMKTQNLQ